MLAMTLVTQVVTKSSYNRVRDRTNREGGRLMIDLIRITYNEWHGGMVAWWYGGMVVK